MDISTFVVKGLKHRLPHFDLKVLWSILTKYIYLVEIFLLRLFGVLSTTLLKVHCIFVAEYSTKNMLGGINLTRYDKAGPMNYRFGSFDRFLYGFRIMISLIWYGLTRSYRKEKLKYTIQCNQNGTSWSRCQLFNPSGILHFQQIHPCLNLLKPYLLKFIQIHLLSKSFFALSNCESIFSCTNC